MTEEAKYPCIDGVNRDPLIDEYLSLLYRRLELERQLLTTKVELENIKRRSSALSFRLGAIGMGAVKEHLESQE